MLNLLNLAGEGPSAYNARYCNASYSVVVSTVKVDRFSQVSGFQYIFRVSDIPTCVKTKRSFEFCRKSLLSLQTVQYCRYQIYGNVNRADDS